MAKINFNNVDFKTAKAIADTAYNSDRQGGMIGKIEFSGSVLTVNGTRNREVTVGAKLYNSVVFSNALSQDALNDIFAEFI